MVQFCESLLATVFLWQDKMHIFPEWDLRWHENEEATTKFGFSRS